jgi:RNA polymerase sigma-70 factor (ECF subfamily)
MGKNLEIDALVDVAAGQPKGTLADEVASLFEAYRAPLLRYLLSLGLSVEAGEEVVQEVFLALFQHLRQNKSREHLRGWIFRVGHNLALKERQRSARRPQLSLDETEVCPALDPEASAAQSERQRLILAVVQALPAQDQHCLHLRAEGLRYREIAQVLGISLGAVALAVSRSLAKVSRVEAL